MTLNHNIYSVKTTQMAMLKINSFKLTIINGDRINLLELFNLSHAMPSRIN